MATTRISDLPAATNLATTDVAPWNVSGVTSQLPWSVIAAKTGNVLSVKDPTYGATGDGSTDDATAIQAADTALAAAGGGTLIFPVPSVYWKIGTGLTISPGNVWYFAGKNDKDNLRNYLFPTSAVATAVSASLGKGIGIINLGIDMTSMADASVGADFDECWWLDFDGIFVQGLIQTNSIGVRVRAGTTGVGSYWNRLRSVSVLGVSGTKLGKGIVISGDSTPDRVNATSLENCEAQNVGTGLSFNYTGSGIVCINCGAESNSGNGVEINNTASGSFINWIGGEVSSNTGWAFSGTGATGRLHAVNVVYSGNGSGNVDTTNLSLGIDQLGANFKNENITAGKSFNGATTNQTVAAADTITSTNLKNRLTAASAIIMTSNPQIADGAADNQLLLLEGSSNTNTITLADGNGLRLAGPMRLGLSSAILLAYSSGAGDWIELGRSPQHGPFVGTLSKNTTPVGNVGGGTDNLMTFAMAANYLNTDGQTIRITAWGTTANNSNPKTVTLAFQGTTLVSQALTVSEAGAWRVVAEVIRSGSNAQSYGGQLVSDTNGGGGTDVLNAFVGTCTETDTSTITIKCTGTVTDGGGGINNNDIQQTGMLVELLN